MKNDYIISADGTTVTIWIKRRTGERFACLVDAADLEKLKALGSSWHAQWNHSGRCFYAATNVTVGRIRTKILMHRYLMAPPQGLEVDHKYHSTLDNRRSELEITTASGNGMNRRGAQRNSHTGHRGIGRHRSKFRLRVTIDGKEKHVGLFETLEEALVARRKFPEYDKKQLGSSEESI